MGKEINYYSFAENDYLYLKNSIEAGFCSNAMASIAQNIIERYLKHIIDVFCKEEDVTAVLKTHSLKRLLRYINTYLNEFKIDEYKVILADGYYFSARYPGDDSFFVNQKDIDVCWEAVQETKRAVDAYLEHHRINRGNNRI